MSLPLLVKKFGCLTAVSAKSRQLMEPCFSSDCCSLNNCHLALFYNYEPLMEGEDPVVVIRQAIPDTLSYFHQLANKTTERLFVDCNRDSLLIVEAEALITLEDLIESPRRSVNYFFPDGYRAVTGPLLQVQITGLLCGGFVVGICWNRMIADQGQMLEFIRVVGEISRGRKTNYFGGHFSVDPYQAIDFGWGRPQYYCESCYLPGSLMEMNTVVRLTGEPFSSIIIQSRL